MVSATQIHPFPPLMDDKSQILILGSFPSPKSRENGFYYGHPQNRFWRILSALWEETLPVTNAEKAALALRHHVALWDVLASCEISGASDTSIRNPVPNDIPGLLAGSRIHIVCTTGTKASALCRRFFPDLPQIRLPSTSPANAAWSFDALVGEYRKILNYLEE